jgi:peptide methionine sulfoxide reductase msrA/msrB
MTKNTIFAVLLAAAAAVPLVFAALNNGGSDDRTDDADDGSVPLSESFMVFDTRGELVGPVPTGSVELSEDAWRERLSDRAFRVLRRDATEPRRSSELLGVKQAGVFTCAGCDLPLFRTATKFDSGTGWPSFYEPIAEKNTGTRRDTSAGMVRTEVHCARCEGHLGHIFPDGPDPTGLRYCINGAALSFTADEELRSIAEVDTAVFAGGCFWCVEAVFEELEGVYSVESGFAGGDGPATYREVVSGGTGHAEAVRIRFDPAEITFEELLRVHFETHNPTTLNRQGPDVGPQYRSVVFYLDQAQREATASMIEKLDASDKYTKDIVTEVAPLDAFYPADAYHQDFVKNNPDNAYVKRWALPKIEKVRERFSDKIEGEANATDRDG